MAGEIVTFKNLLELYLPTTFIILQLKLQLSNELQEFASQTNC